MDKIIRLLFDVNIRIVYVPKKKCGHFRDELREIAGSFKQFDLPYLNDFVIRKLYKGPVIAKRYHDRLIVKPLF